MSSSKSEGIPPGAKRFLFALAIFVVLGAIYELNQKTGILFDPLFKDEDLNITSKTLPTGPSYKVLDVIDGDTIEVQYGTVRERIRLIGINAPEINNQSGRVLCLGEEAKDRLEEVAEGEMVVLEFDDTQDLRDTYERLLAYAYLSTDGQMLNRKMVAEGLAYEYTFLKPYKYQESFKQVENMARGAKSGLWGDLCRK